MGERRQVLLDTDIGTDVDDCLALGVLLGSPEVELLGVTTVYGDVALRAAMVRRLLALRGVADIPVVEGAAEPLLRLRPVYWAGHEGAGLLDTTAPGGPVPTSAGGPSRHAAELIAAAVRGAPGQVHLLAIGPLTNVALAFSLAPDLPGKLARLTVMGGVLRLGPGGAELPVVEHNVASDPEAAHLVLSAGAPTTLVPLDVTTRVWAGPADVAALAARGTAYHAAVADQLRRYLHAVGRERTNLHDPLAAAVALGIAPVTLHRLRVDVELAGRLCAGATIGRAPTFDEPGIDVALDVDPAAAADLIRDRIAR